VTFGARARAALDDTLLANHVTEEGHGAIRGNRDASLIVPGAVADGRALGHRLETVRGFEDEFAGLDPVIFGPELGRFESDLRLVLLYLIKIPRGLPVGMIDGVAPVDRARRNGIVVLGRDVFGRGSRISKRNFEGGHGGVVPGLRDLDRCERPRDCDGEKCDKNSAKHAAIIATKAPESKRS
jgi:hypothetical protein